MRHLETVWRLEEGEWRTISDVTTPSRRDIEVET